MRLLFAGLSLAALAGCGAASTASAPVTPAPPPAAVSVSVSPANATVPVGGASKGFTATVSNASTGSVTWQVNGVDGGNSVLGTISSSGLYLSPAVMPASGTVTVTAVSVADPTKQGNATLSLTDPPPPVAVAVSPSTATLAAGGAAQVFVATVSNATDTSVTWQVNGVPGGNSALGSINSSGSYKPPAAPPAQPTVTLTAVSVQDPTKAASAAVTIVSSVTAPPTISGSPTLSVAAGSSYLFTPTASSPRGGTLTFSIANKPSWAAFSSVTGTLSGTPSSANVGVTSSVTISVADGTASASLAPFAITVTATAPSPPTISGAPPATVKVGQTYSFTPTTTNPSGGTLTFSIANKPAWATFSTASGKLSGAPAVGDIGTFAGVSISVSNGSASASLAPFTITVQAGSTGSATLSWTAPTTRMDGTPLTNLAGFRIYYGNAVGNYPNVLAVSNPGLTTYVVPNLQSGTYFFVGTAVDATGAESDYSTVASVTIP